MSKAKGLTAIATLFGALSLGSWLVGTVPATAQSFRWQAISLSLNSGQRTAGLRGSARGMTGLHNIVGDRDSRQNRCLGFGALTPDHVLNLTTNIDQLTFQVETANQDTTLVIQGPNRQVYCGDDSSRGKDAGLSLQNLKSGEYKVWVGTFDQGQRFPYRLTIR